MLAGTICPAADSLKVGDKAPDFSAAASNDTTVKLSDLIGKGNIVLYFYPKDDTPGCTKEACGIRDSIVELKGLDAIVFGVSFDSVESHKQFIAKYKLPFVLLADTDKKVAKAYGIADDSSPVATRATFIIGKDGKIAYVNPKVNAATHAAEIRTALAALEK
jgi:peroxiredoxin Q/BCP